MKDQVIQTRIEPKVKAEAEAVLKELGLSLSDGIRLFLNQVRVNRGIPFMPTVLHIPNEVTKQAIKDVENGEYFEFNSIEEMMAELDKDD